MKTKKIVAYLSAFVLMAITAVPIFASEVVSSTYQKELMHYAYMDLESADEFLEPQILEARNEIIMNTSWVAEGIEGYVADENGNIIEVVPQFHEVFPSDWDIPVFSDDGQASQQPQRSTELGGGPHFVYLDNPSTTVNSPKFATIDCEFILDYQYKYVTSIMTFGYCCNSTLKNPTCNVGYTNRSTGASLGLKTRLPESQSFVISPPENAIVDVRASTYSTPSEWQMNVFFETTGI